MPRIPEINGVLDPSLEHALATLAENVQRDMDAMIQSRDQPCFPRFRLRPISLVRRFFRTQLQSGWTLLVLLFAFVVILLFVGKQIQVLPEAAFVPALQTVSLVSLILSALRIPRRSR